LKGNEHHPGRETTPAENFLNVQSYGCIEGRHNDGEREAAKYSADNTLLP